MKKLFFVLLIICFSNKLFAQAYNTYIDYKKGKSPAVASVIDAPKDIVKVALDEDLKRSGLNGKISNGFKLYKNVVFPKFGKDNIDIYTVVKDDDEKTPERCIVYMMVMKNATGSFVSPGDDYQMVDNIKSYLDNFHVSAKNVTFEVQIAEQQKALDKANKRLNSLLTDSIDIVKKREDLQIVGEGNHIELDSQRNEIKMLQQVLDNMITEKGKQNK